MTDIGSGIGGAIDGLATCLGHALGSLVDGLAGLIGGAVQSVLGAGPIALALLVVVVLGALILVARR
jgi:hypothetical protein